MKKFLTVIGTRPNIIKITRFKKVAQNHPAIDIKLVHTAQHFSSNMSEVFFTELGLDQPDFFLQYQANSVVTQFAEIMKGLESVINNYRPDYMIVVGDVNSTLAAALTGNKMNIPLLHLESGLRSGDRSMPEEHNRVLTDSLTDIFFITEESGRQNLIKEGKNPQSLHFVGNTMIDTLVAYDDVISKSAILNKYDLKPGAYALMTMHRPGNVDTREGLLKLLEVIDELTKDTTIVFPIHPRTLNRFREFDLFSRIESNKRLRLTEPAGYLDFQKLILHALFVITDSGGIQEETTFRRIPCITLRPNTERPVTVDIGSNTMMGFDKEKIVQVVQSIRKGTYKACNIPPLWDGRSTERIFEVLENL